MLVKVPRIDSLPFRIFVTADHHFGHENIIKFCDRPFSSAQHMDEWLIGKWNSVVSEDDMVLHLGDFTLTETETAVRYIRELNGRIAVLGNVWHHDKRWLGGSMTPCGEVDVYQLTTLCVGSVLPYVLPPIVVLEIDVGSEYAKAVTLCHYPLRHWDRQHYGGFHFHGHSHGQIEDEPGRIDVGVDSHEFMPVPLGKAMYMVKDH